MGNGFECSEFKILDGEPRFPDESSPTSCFFALSLTRKLAWVFVIFEIIFRIYDIIIFRKRLSEKLNIAVNLGNEDKTICQ
jgi:hypothetical protein